MRVLVDANVLLDVLMQRPGFFIEASEVWKAAEQKEFEGLVSAISFTTIHYILRRHSGKAAADEAVKLIAGVFGVAAVDSKVIADAVARPGVDFEDAVQAASGLHGGATHAVTRDASGFSSSGLRVVAPGSHIVRTVDADILRDGRERWPTECSKTLSKHLFERVSSPERRPLWASRILKTCVGHLSVDSPEIARVLDVAENPAEWKHGHDAFSTVRQSALNLTKLKPLTMPQQILVRLLTIAELVAKVTYNATAPPDQFDQDSGCFIAMSASHLCKTVSDKTFSDAVWNAMV